MLAHCLWTNKIVTSCHFEELPIAITASSDRRKFNLFFTFLFLSNTTEMYETLNYVVCTGVFLITCSK